LTLDPDIRHTVVHHSSTSTCIPNFIEIEETFCGRTDGHFPPSNIIRSTFGSWPNNSKFRRVNTDSVKGFQHVWGGQVELVKYYPMTVLHCLDKNTYKPHKNTLENWHNSTTPPPLLPPPLPPPPTPHHHHITPPPSPPVLSVLVLTSLSFQKLHYYSRWNQVCHRFPKGNLWWFTLFLSATPLPMTFGSFNLTVEHISYLTPACISQRIRQM